MQLLIELPSLDWPCCAVSLQEICVNLVPLQTCLTQQGLLLQILGALHAIHAVAVFFKLMSPALYSPGAGRRGRGMYTLVILNSLNLAVACRYACSLHAAVFFGSLWVTGGTFAIWNVPAHLTDTYHVAALQAHGLCAATLGRIY